MISPNTIVGICFFIIGILALSMIVFPKKAILQSNEKVKKSQKKEVKLKENNGVREEDTYENVRIALGLNYIKSQLNEGDKK